MRQTLMQGEGTDADRIAIAELVIHARSGEAAESEKPEGTEAPVTGPARRDRPGIAGADPQLGAGSLLHRSNPADICVRRGAKCC